MRVSHPERRPAACVGAWRHLRAASVSLTALGLAVGGHMYGGGMVPSLISFLAVWALAAVFSWRLSRRRWTVRTLVAVLVLAQAVMHALCDLQSDMAMAGGGSTMLAAHGVATAVSVAALRYGEATGWALLEVLLLRPTGAALRLTGPVVLHRALRVHVWNDVRAFASRLLVCVDPMRGPPLVG